MADELRKETLDERLSRLIADPQARERFKKSLTPAGMQVIMGPSDASSIFDSDRDIDWLLNDAMEAK